jgi:hypothetical protein
MCATGDITYVFPPFLPSNTEQTQYDDLLAPFSLREGLFYGHKQKERSRKAWGLLLRFYRPSCLNSVHRRGALYKTTCAGRAFPEFDFLNAWARICNPFLCCLWVVEEGFFVETERREEMRKLIPCMIGLAILLLGGESQNTAIGAASLDFSCAEVTEIPQSECEALVALYHSTNGDHWRYNSWWLVTTRPCRWYGVTCSAAGHVRRLLLSHNQLTGSIPPELGNLSSLESLLLSHNQLTGSIPPELGNLSSLLSLWLFSNQLMGSIPPELGNLSSLLSLWLFSNQLTGSIPPELGNLSSLWSLLLSHNQLTGSIPPELGNLSRLSSLRLSSNQLTGSIPPELGNLSRLEWLELHNNLFSGPLPVSLTNLVYLNAFRFANTDLCKPDDPAFRAWLNSVPIVWSTDFYCGGARVINDSLNLDDIDTSYSPSDSRAPAGVFTISATFTNTSSDLLSNVFFEVVRPTYAFTGDMVLNADSGPGGVGAKVSVPGIINPGDSFEVVFEIGLQEQAPFNFFVDAYGVLAP